MRFARLLAAVCIVLIINQIASASAIVRGAYYRLGDDGPGAAAGAIGNDPTKDSFGDKLDVTRFGTPDCSSIIK